MEHIVFPLGPGSIQIFVGENHSDGKIQLFIEKLIQGRCTIQALLLYNTVTYFHPVFIYMHVRVKRAILAL